MHSFHFIVSVYILGCLASFSLLYIAYFLEKEDSHKSPYFLAAQISYCFCWSVALASFFILLVDLLQSISLVIAQ